MYLSLQILFVIQSSPSSKPTFEGSKETQTFLDMSFLTSLGAETFTGRKVTSRVRSGSKTTKFSDNEQRLWAGTRVFCCRATPATFSFNPSLTLPALPSGRLKILILRVMLNMNKSTVTALMHLTKPRHDDTAGRWTTKPSFSGSRSPTATSSTLRPISS